MAGQNLLDFTLLPKSSIKGGILAFPSKVSVSYVWPSPERLQPSRMRHLVDLGAETTICSAKRFFVGTGTVRIIVFVLSAQLSCGTVPQNWRSTLLSAPTLTAAHRTPGQHLSYHRTEPAG